jgi:hypothetical protein
MGTSRELPVEQSSRFLHCRRTSGENSSGTSSGIEFSLSSLYENIGWEHVGNYKVNRVLAFITAKEHQVRTSREL